MRRLSFRRVLHWSKLFLFALFCSLWFIALFRPNQRSIYSMPHYVFLHSEDHIKLPIQFCFLHQHHLQPQSIDIHHSPNVNAILTANQPVNLGGHWRPTSCKPFQTVAIVIPYRNRWFHLRILLNRLHPMLRRQSVSYRIFVVEQSFSEASFNRGMLFNVGIKEALKFHNFDCFIFHDVDLIPEHDRNIYLCDNHVRHLSSAIDEMRYHLMYENYAGGVAALSLENVLKINGFSNSYWGWGNEDDDFSARTFALDLKLSRPPEHIGRYKMVRHQKAERSGGGYGRFLKWRDRQFKDGFNSLSSRNYRLLNVNEEQLYTNITVDLWKPKLLDNGGRQENLLWFLRFYGYI